MLINGRQEPVETNRAWARRSAVDEQQRRCGGRRYRRVRRRDVAVGAVGVSRARASGRAAGGGTFLVSESKGGTEPVSHHPPHLAVAGARGRLQPLLSFSPQPTSPPASKQARKSTRHGTAGASARGGASQKRAGQEITMPLEGGREEEDGRRSSPVRSEEDPRRDPGAEHVRPRTA
jgi:hypothetical protein